MPSRAVLLALALPLVACTPTPYTVTQHGLIAAPRAAVYDGQPIASRLQVEGHLDAARVKIPGNVPESGAAVARWQAGGALRVAINENSDLGIETDAAWAKTASTLSGDSSVSTGVPDAPVIDAAVAFRTSAGQGPFRLGLSLALGLSSCPIRREGAVDHERDGALLARAALVPSYRRGDLTLFVSIGGSTQATIGEEFVVEPSTLFDNDPGVVAEAGQLALTVAAGASLDLGGGAHLTGRIGEVYAHDASFGPQALVGFSMDLGESLRSQRAVP